MSHNRIELLACDSVGIALMFVINIILLYLLK
jgi:hypothetical protein